jgi:hypothetical protein
MRADGTIDYLIDGMLVVNTHDITPNYFGDIYLAAHSLGASPGQKIVFTDYQTGTDYVYTKPPVGGEWVPMDKLQLIAPLAGLATVMAVLTTCFVYIERKKKQ